MKRRLAITYILNLFDLVATYFWYSSYGLSLEINPIGRVLLSTGLAIPVKVIGVGAAVFSIYEYIKRTPNREWISWVVFVVYGALAIYHIINTIIFFTITGG